jgi:UDP-N-acetylglucosamine:LPS N-acetylglucosamine transferase
MVKDEDLPAQLVPVLSELLNDAKALDAMRVAMKSLAQPEAGQRLAALVRELAGAYPQGGNA